MSSVDDLLKMTTRSRTEPVTRRQEELDSDDDYTSHGAGKPSFELNRKPFVQVNALDRRRPPLRLVTDSSTPRPDRHDSPESSTDSLYEVLQRQNEVTEMLIKQQSLSQLPHRDIPTFTGDPLTYRSFIRAIEHAIDSKTDSHQDRLYYLEQFTSGEPLNLVRSCEHMRPDRVYKEARALLDRHYGDELPQLTSRKQWNGLR